MPELAEVEITRRALGPLIRGRRILDFWTDWPRGLRANSKGRMANGARWVAGDIQGRVIRNVERRGKVLFFKLSGQPPRTMAVHLRMSGRLEVTSRSTGRHPEQQRRVSSSLPERWTHFRWQLNGGRKLRFIDPRKFGRVWYGSPEALGRDPYLGRIGLDARGISRNDFLRLLARRRGMVKPLLLRQDILSGIGNIIADESLWRARIHPRTAVMALHDRSLAALHTGISRTIGAMLTSGGTSIRNFRHPDGRLGRYQERRLVYGKAGEPCPRCRAQLRRIVVAGRGTTVCPRCQKQRGND